MKAKGTIYEEVTCTRQSPTIGRVIKKRFVGEIVINGKRYRFRSTNKDNVEKRLQTLTGVNAEYKVSKNERLSSIMQDQSKRIQEYRKRLQEQRIREREIIYKDADIDKRVTGRIPENHIRVLRYRLWSDILSFGVVNGRPMHAENFGYWTIAKEKGKVFIVCSTKPKVGYNKITTRENLTLFQSSANTLLQELDKDLGKILRHGQFLKVVSREVRANGDLYLELNT